MAADERPRPKRKQIRGKLRAALLERADGLCECGCGEELEEGKIDFDHDPPLELRNLTEDGLDYEPAQLDPDYLFALRRACHREKTRKDQGRIAKARRLRKGPKAPGSWPKQKFPKRARKPKWPKKPWPKKPTT